MKITIIRGIPGSGKSTHAKNNYECLHLEADMFCIINSGYVFDIKKHKSNHAKCLDIARSAISHGCDIVVSNTFTQVWEMQPYIELAEEYGAKLEVVRMCREFTSTHNVPGFVIDKMRDRFEPFNGEIGVYPEVTP